MPEQQDEAPDPGAWRKDPAPQEEQKPAEMPGVTEGRMVHFVLPNGMHRPAVIVRNWRASTGSCNLQVLLDGTNDNMDLEELPEIKPGAVRYPKPTREECERGLLWRTSITYSEEKLEGTWHWIEKV